MLEKHILSRMLSAARRAQRAAHAPYSNFQVGACLLTDSGRLIPGCNVENASYGLTICAERNAIFRMVAERAGRPVACLVVGPTVSPLTPCGACRQVLLEFNPAMEIYCVGQDGTMLVRTLSELLPLSFGSADLEAALKKG